MASLMGSCSLVTGELFCCWGVDCCCSICINLLAGVLIACVGVKASLRRMMPDLSVDAYTHTHTHTLNLEAAHGTKYHDGSVLDESRTNGNKLCL